MTTISHHPTDETLVAFASATLREANSLVVATHISHCPACRDSIRNITLLAGGLLEELGAASVAAATRSACFAKLDSQEAQPAPKPVSRQSPSPLESSAGPLSLYPHGEWQWLSPGIQLQKIDVPSNTGTRVFLLKAAPGKRLPDHKHLGTEWTCVLQGAFHHDGGRFGPGDFDEADSSLDHNPQVEEGIECICLVAMSGNIEMKSWIGRMIQPFVKF